MQLVLRRASMILFAVLSVYMIVFGLLYGTTTMLLPHHAAATPEAAEQQVLPLYLAIMRLVGAAAMALGLVCLFVVIDSVRRGSNMAALVVTFGLSGFFTSAAFAATRLAAATETQTHWYVMAGLSILTLGAFATHLIGWRAKA